GVLLRTEDHEPRELWAERLGISAAELNRLVFQSKASRLATVGRGQVEAIWQGLADRFDLASPEREQLERDFWSGDEVDRELLSFVRDLRPTYKTALLSNAWPDVRHFIENVWGFADAFDQVIISAEVGFAKPDPRIYQLALNKLDVEANEAVFVDDFEENVHGARQVGMHAIHFRSPEQVKQDLKTLLTRS
ncbi:MAG: HAD family hydrolase, partial [Anaerolineales bacterium]